MSKILKRLNSKNLITPPSWLIDNVHYLCMMGSIAYGVNTDNSDIDIYGYCIPPKRIIFPHTDGVIYGFDNNYEKFKNWQQHHIKDKEADKEYDFDIYSIVRYFALVAQNNPNMIDSLFVPRNCIIHSTKIGEMIREKRKMFLHKGSWYKFKGYAYSQMHKMNIKEPKPESKRYESIMKHGYDLKFAYHVVRLLNEGEQILTEGDIDLQQNREQLKAIRRGEWTKEQVENYFAKKESDLETVYSNCKIIPHKPNMIAIKELLINCLEEHYGNLNNVIQKSDSSYKNILHEIKNLIEMNI